MTTFEASSGPPADVAADLLIVPFFSDRVPGPGFAEVAKALGADLAATLAENHVGGRVGESLLVPTLGRLKATTVLLRRAGSEGRGRHARDPQCPSQGRPPGLTVEGGGHDAAPGRPFGRGVRLRGGRGHHAGRVPVRPLQGAPDRRGLQGALGAEAAGGGRGPGRRRDRGGHEARPDPTPSRRTGLATSSTRRRSTPPPMPSLARPRTMASKVGLTLQGMDEGPARARRVRRASSASARAASNEPRLVELTYSGGGRRPRRSRSPARASRSTPAACRSRTRGGMETMKDDMSGGGGGARRDAGDRPAQAEGERDRGDPVRREHAERLGDPAGRRAAPPRRQDLRGAEHRRRGPAGAGRRARATWPRRSRPRSSTRRR